MRSEVSYDRPGVVYHNNGAPGGDSSHRSVLNHRVSKPRE